MKNTRGFFRCVALGLLAVFFGGCEHKEFCLDHSHAMLFDVVFDWELAPGAEPESMSLYMFPDGGGRPVRHEMPGNAGGTIRVQAGGYGALCFNGDTESIRCLHTETLEGFEITTRQASLLQGFSSRASMRLHRGPKARKASVWLRSRICCGAGVRRA